jgi:hypothetical protein
LESQVVEKDFGEYLIDVEEIIKKLISIENSTNELK